MLWSVVLLPLLAAPLLWFWRSQRRARTAMAMVIVAADLGLAALAILHGWGGSYGWSELLTLTLQLSPPGALFAIAVPLVTLPVVLYAGGQELAPGRAQPADRRLLSLMLLFLGAMQLLVLAGDFLTLLIGWELVGACSWALIAHHWQRHTVAGHANQALLITRFGDLGLYVAGAAVFAGTGSLALEGLGDLDTNLKGLAAAGIILAAAAKSAQVPFSPWLFAAMSGPVSVSALLHSATMVAAGIWLVTRLSLPLTDTPGVPEIMVLIGTTTALTGGLVATVQHHAKKVLAASTSAQFGLMWVAVGAGFPAAALAHFFTHAFLKAGLFLSVGIAAGQSGSFLLNTMGLGGRLPGIARASLILSLALAGVVPLGAAWSKEQLVAAAGHSSTVLAVLVALAGGLSALYAMRLHLLVWGTRPGQQSESPSPSVPGVTALFVLTGATLLLTVLWLPGASNWIEAQSSALPDARIREFILSMALVLGGLALAVRFRGPQDVVAHVPEDWLGLVRAFRAIARGSAFMTSRLARLDDRAVDAGLNLTARLARWLARTGASTGERKLDAIPWGLAQAGLWLAGWQARNGEALFDRLPGELTRFTDTGGSWARKAQSGHMHHYYAALTLGFTLLLVIALAGALL